VAARPAGEEASLRNESYRQGVAELPYPEPPLADERVLLRPWVELEVPAALLARENAAGELGWPDEALFTAQDARRFFLEQENARRAGEELHFAFVDPASPTKVLGGGSLYAIDRRHGRAAVGYWVLPEARGHGIATHAVRLLARHAFEGLQVARLELTCGPENEASKRVAEHCGFTREGVLRSHIAHAAGRRDTVIYSLLAGELVAA
jgi:RimJ/RimL family protein N-acetyltransferase